MCIRDSSHTDELIGTILSALRSRGDSNNTIVVLVSDHGWHLGEQSMWAKCTLFDAALRAPLVIKLPGVTTPDAGGAVVAKDAFTEHVDIFPTCLLYTSPSPRDS
eukprot:TRINITY_DN20859_c0_g2_i1.p2 TRINITY_DN20859_c0_g2~~TRINITY_DN20859_c0_g2_i1.p2  ORF type:complete len:105 (+),score=24.07 TRINITY_DN20859_c0_g2_i1:150-464(+)